MMNRKVHRILLIDDDIDGRMLTERALKKVLPPGSTVHLADCGNRAIAYMIGEGPFSDRKQYPFPTLIITDLNMSDGDGFDVLEFLQSNPEWGVVPRIMFSSSEDEDDVRTAFLLGASAYHVKSGGPEKLVDCMQSILDYWTTSEVPPVDENGRLSTTSSVGRRGARYPQPKGAPRMKRPKPRVGTATADKREPAVTRLF